MPIKIAMISYLNTLPFRYGLDLYPFTYPVEVQYLTPAKAAQSVIEGNSHLGIMPSATLPKFGVDRVISDWCIGADGEVGSVVICSNRTISECRVLYMDNHSKTSQQLARLLLKKRWNIEPQLLPFSYENESIESDKSYLLIGDKALLHKGSFSYIYDLAEEWKGLTQLPFVFACWVARNTLESAFIEQFNSAMEFGVNNIERAIEWEKNSFGVEFTRHYLTNQISYPLDDKKREGLMEFLKMGESLQLG